MGIAIIQTNDINLVQYSSKSSKDLSVHLEKLSIEKSVIPIAVDLLQTGANSKKNFRIYDGYRTNDKIDFLKKSVLATCKKCKKEVKTKCKQTFLSWPTQFYCWV